MARRAIVVAAENNRWRHESGPLDAFQPQHVQPYLTSLSWLPSIDQKRLPEDFGLETRLEGVQPPEEPQGLLPSEHRLSKENLQILENLVREDMGPTANNAQALTRTSSRRSVATSEVGTERSKSPQISHSVYRYKHLRAFKIYIHAEPPDHIQAAINHIINADVSKERRAEIQVVSQQLRAGCLQNVRAQAGEDDFIHPLHIALMALGFKNICLHEKADWREELKPTVPQKSKFSSSFMSGIQQRGDSAPPRKRQKQSTSEPSTSSEFSRSHVANETPANKPQESSAMPPPALPKDGSVIRTPRPDISIGIQLTALISALSSQNLNKIDAMEFLTWLQNEMTQHKPDGPLEPMLLPLPAPRALDLAFPFAVVEGKSYSTGKQIFEAENQAAVSGACALKIQLDLDNLIDAGGTSSDAPPASSNIEPPLFFSICTQGPIHELWVHWTVVEEGVRMFESSFWTVVTRCC